MSDARNWTPRIPGVTISMDGQDWVVPPLTLGQLRRLLPRVKELTTVGVNMGPEQVDTLIELVTAAIVRNYPDQTLETVAEMLDTANAQDVMAAVLKGSGLKPGEARAVAGNGVTSMDYSPPLADTATQ